jgi:TolA-binding protein
VFLVVALALLAGCMSVREPAQYDDARARAAAFIEDEFQAAMALAAELKYEAAGEKFAALAEAYEGENPVNRPRAAECTFWLGYCREKLDAANEAVTAYRRVLERYPDLPAARQAERRLRALEDAVGGAGKSE